MVNKTILSKKYEFLISNFYRKYLLFLHNKNILKKKYISDVEKYFADNLEEINYLIITPSFKISFDDSDKKFLKENIQCSKKIKMNINNGINRREIYICCIKNIKFFGSSGGIAYNNLPIIESTFGINRFKRSITVDSAILKHRNMKGVYTSIMHYFDGINYYHWLIENIPRLYGILKLKEPEINLIVHKGISKLQLDTLKIFLDDRFKIIPIGLHEVWKLEKFYFSSFCTGGCSGYMPKEYLEFVKSKIINAYGINIKNKDKRIYISRNKAPKRRLKNEKQFYELIKKYNFERIYAEDLSFKEQVKLFNSSRIIVSIHGAGLSNIIFSENLKIIEIHAPKNINTHYFMLAKALGFDYKYIIGYKQDKNLDFYVNLSDIEDLITTFL